MIIQMNTYLLLKHLHVSFVCVSAFGFLLRGYWMMTSNPQLQQRWVRIAPHAVDTALLVSAISLAWYASLSPVQQPWLLAKIIALIAYVISGSFALKRAKSKTAQACWFGVAVSFLVYIILVAVTKSPALGLAS